MIVNDAFELYTTVMGWHINNGLFQLMMGTGIILIPFAFIIGGNIIEARNNRDKDDIGVSFFNKTEMQLYVAFFVLLLCVNPMVNLSVSNMKAMDSTCAPGDGGSTPEVEENEYRNTGTTYDQVQELDLGADTIKIPVVWYVWDYVASSLSLSAKATLPCQTDIRRISTIVSTTKIEDTSLADEFGMFMRDCWRPSLNRYLHDKPPAYTMGGAPADDIEWAGSEVFLYGRQYYRHFRAEEGLSSLPFDSLRDEAKATNSTLADGKGYPFCDEWWVSPDNGLRDRLIDHFKTDHTDLATFWPEYVQAQVNNNVTPRPTYDDMLLKTILMTDIDTRKMVIGNNYPRSTLRERASDGSAMASRGVAIMTDIMSIGDRSKALVTQTAAPMLRAILLMVITFLIPIMLIASGYSLGAVVTIMLVKFSIYFWIFLFAVAAWLDNYLLAAWSGVTDGDLSGWIIFNSRYSQGENMDIAVSALNFITRWMHILLPILFTSLLAAVGIKAGGLDSTLTGSGMREAGDAGKSAPNDVKNLGSK